MLTHLERVARRLTSYGASETLQLAGLTHAAYGTDGFDTALLGLDERALLQDAVGLEAEALVHAYGATDRQVLYRQLGQPLVVWRDRWSGAQRTLDPADVAPLVELTVANELDVVLHSPAVREEFGDGLRGLFTRARVAMSPAAWADVSEVLGA